MEGVSGGAGQPVSPGCVGQGEPLDSARGLLGRGRAPGVGEGRAGAPVTVGPARSRSGRLVDSGGAGLKWSRGPLWLLSTSGTWGRERAKRSWPWALVQAALPSLGAVG